MRDNGLNIDSGTPRFTRRQLLTGCVIAGGTVLAGFDLISGLEPDATADGDAFLGGTRLDQVNFVDEPVVPLNTPYGTELDGRLVTDLATLTPADHVTPNGQFYVRTRASDLLDVWKPWVIKIRPGAGKVLELTLDRLKSMARPSGLHLMECAGNNRTVHFGLLSAAEWTGVPVSDILESAGITAEAHRVLISGFDRYFAPSITSIPGASWIFTASDLEAANAFLATAMNGGPLSRDHGAPVRLLVPGWYGCACIKWVNEIVLVNDDVDATSQMQEYATRTNQLGIPIVARDYKPAIVEQAAMPIRVDKWLVSGKSKYRVIGIFWGGSAPVTALEIRFNPTEEYSRVDSIIHGAAGTWSFWTHAWQPTRPGKYAIQLKVKDPPVPTPRLDSGHYVRSVEITQV